MYLKQVVVKNNGPLQQLDLTLAFSDEGLPKPLILVGGNGSGKTNFLSLIGDALFESAAVHYNNVLPAQGNNRSWFRIVGGRTITIGTSGSFSLLRFDDAGTSRFYTEKSGSVDPSVISSHVPAEFREQITWPKEGSVKTFVINDDRSRLIFEEGVYAYFPSSRSEVPYWLNRAAISETEFDVAPKFSKHLSKPIYIEHALDKFKQWLIGVLSDSRTEIIQKLTATGIQWGFVGNPLQAQESSSVVSVCNRILQSIFCDDTVRFVWLGRKSPDKVGIARGNSLAFPTLDALSTGQAILLGMFGSLLRYGDLSQNSSALDLSSIIGICLIDEIDAHMHVELQYRIIPKLIKLFPKVQFILTNHSPLFVLGMEKAFGDEGIQVIDMPSGVPVGAEAYAEFGHALEALAASHAFTERVISEGRRGSKPIVYVEGETDAPYLRRAAELLDKPNILTNCDIEWIGSKDENGQGFHTGKDALKHTLSVLKANPDLINRRVLLLYDNDSKTPDQDYDGFSVRTLPINDKNTIVTAGIENLLPEECLTSDFYQTRETKKANGDVTLTKTIRKADLCSEVCRNGSVTQFAAFTSALEIIENFLKLPTEG
ncbi:AAA family ATPase [Acetobacter tropicalis]|nr:AAA family ATPase [Acetobacter tropicalis]